MRVFWQTTHLGMKNRNSQAEVLHSDWEVCQSLPPLVALNGLVDLGHSFLGVFSVSPHNGEVARQLPQVGDVTVNAKLIPLCSVLLSRLLAVLAHRTIGTGNPE